MRKIVGFYHVCLINNWREIVLEQLQLMQQSGLMDAIDKLFVGCVGERELQLELQQMLTTWPKATLASMLGDIQAYEFPTLEYMHKWCQNNREHYCFYIHTKGVFDARGAYWRQYMNHYNLEKWQDCKFELFKGADMVGVKWMKANRLFPQHFSGNFWWARAAYIANLLPIKMLDKTHRWNAEFWHGTGNPTIATLCQAMIDHKNMPNYKN